MGVFGSSVQKKGSNKPTFSRGGVFGSGNRETSQIKPQFRYSAITVFSKIQKSLKSHYSGD